MNEKTIGERLRDLRKQNNLTQDDLANALGVSRVQINQWESGAREISTSRIIKIAEHFGTSCDFILLGKDVTANTVSFPETVTKEKTIAVSENPLKDVLSESSFEALNDINKMDAEKKKTCKDILNGLIGSNAFWIKLMPSASAAYTVKKQSAMGGSLDTIPSVPNEMIDKLEDSAKVIELGNSLGYMDNLLISNEKAYKFQINEATDAFRNILTATIDQKAIPEDKKNAEWTEKYESRETKNDLAKGFADFLKQFGINFN